MIFLISASCVAKITGVSHRCPAPGSFYGQFTAWAGWTSRLKCDGMRRVCYDANRLSGETPARPVYLDSPWALFQRPGLSGIGESYTLLSDKEGQRMEKKHACIF
jgi:hypothetical protein